MRLVAEVAVLLLVLGGIAHGQVTTAFRACAGRQISADPFAGLSGAEADTEVEPDIAVDPNDPDVVVAVFQQGRFDLLERTIVLVTGDHGEECYEHGYWEWRWRRAGRWWNLTASAGPG